MRRTVHDFYKKSRTRLLDVEHLFTVDAMVNTLFIRENIPGNDMALALIGIGLQNITLIFIRNEAKQKLSGLVVRSRERMLSEVHEKYDGYFL
jgi:hypothetical protein